jgi:hypothetical protein
VEDGGGLVITYKGLPSTATRQRLRANLRRMMTRWWISVILDFDASMQSYKQGFGVKSSSLWEGWEWNRLSRSILICRQNQSCSVITVNVISRST